MIDSRRYAVGAVAMVAVLTGCGGQASNGVMPTSGALDHLPNHKSFYYTGAAQSFKVPKGVTRIDVVASSVSGSLKTRPVWEGRPSRICPGFVPVAVLHNG